MTPDNSPQAAYADWKQWHAERFAHCSKGDTRYFGWLLARWHPAPIGRALEIGFGNGNFLGFARGRDIQVDGIEAQDELLRRARDAGFEVFGAVSELPEKARYNLIAAFDVFEHIPQDDIAALMRELGGRLLHDGILLLRVPNGESPLGRMLQNGDLTHVTTLGLSKFKQLAALSGLVVLGHGEMPWYATARNPKRLLRAAVARLIERMLAFAYIWDADALRPNLVVAFGRQDKPT